MRDDERTAKKAGQDDDTGKASFKFNLLETVNADPRMRPADLCLVAAYLSFMTWPERRSWLSTSRARAMTGLSERQIITSRKRVHQRGYFAVAGHRGPTAIFRMENPRHEDMRQHVGIATAHYKEVQRDRQAERRRKQAVHAASAETENPCHTRHDDCYVSAINAGNSPEHTPQNLAMKGKHTFSRSEISAASQANGYAPRCEDPNLPFTVPESQEEMEAMLSDLLIGCELSPAVMIYFRKKLLARELTPAIIEGYRRTA